jgi:hypothetical protein
MAGFNNRRYEDGFIAHFLIRFVFIQWNHSCKNVLGGK